MERADQGCFTMTDILTVHVVVVVVPVQRHQHLVLQLPRQDLLLITHLEGNGAVKHQREPSSGGCGLVQPIRGAFKAH